MKIAILMRGWPGGGKSYKANELSKKYDAKICSADDFFMVNGKYVFNPSKLGQAHGICLSKFQKEVKEGKNVIVDNTNLTYSDTSKYLTELEDKGYKVCIYEVTYNDIEKAIKHRKDSEIGKNIPEDKMRMMYDKFYSNNVIKMAKERHPNLEFVSKESL